MTQHSTLPRRAAGTASDVPGGAGRDVTADIRDENHDHSKDERSRREARPETPADRPSRSRQMSIRQHPYLTAAAIIGLVVAILAGVLWWLQARQFESTDDAFIDARTIAVSSQVNGAIVDVPVTDNQLVEAGAVLARIDPRDYQAQFDQANAQIVQVTANIANLDAQIDAQQARVEQAAKQVAEAEGALNFAKQENTRYQDLLAKGAGTEQRAQQATSDLQQKQASYDAAIANSTAAQKQLPVLRTQRDSTQAQLDAVKATRDAAQANLNRTTITASMPGRVTKLTAGKGAYAAVGQALMMFVPREIWVTANYKETQLALMRPGQPVTITVDAYSGRKFDGHVDSIQSGSGTAFSLLPAENATGNYVKIVQRVPVKIVFDAAPDVPLGPGMSVVPTVKVR
jgi:membrane fusion protein (multidrug efflux system)